MRQESPFPAHLKQCGVRRFSRGRLKAELQTRSTGVHGFGFVFPSVRCPNTGDRVGFVGEIEFRVWVRLVIFMSLCDLWVLCGKKILRFLRLPLFFCVHLCSSVFICVNLRLNLHDFCSGAFANASTWVSVRRNWFVSVTGRGHLPRVNHKSAVRNRRRSLFSYDFSEMRKAGKRKAGMFRQDLQDLQDWGASILSILLILSKTSSWQKCRLRFGTAKYVTVKSLNGDWLNEAGIWPTSDLRSPTSCRFTIA